MRISDWSSDVCSSDLQVEGRVGRVEGTAAGGLQALLRGHLGEEGDQPPGGEDGVAAAVRLARMGRLALEASLEEIAALVAVHDAHAGRLADDHRSEEHTSELQSLMRISYAVFCFKKKKK